MNIAFYGPGRAGGALALAAHRAGHSIASIDGRNRAAVAALAGSVDIAGGNADLLVVAVADDAIRTVAVERAAGPIPPAVVHMSGAVPVDALAPCAEAGAAIGSFHPLQTFPSARAGADRFPGSHVAITASDELSSDLESFALSLGATPFRLPDESKVLYHAAAAAAANFTMTSLGIADELFRSAGVDPAVARPLVEAIVGNAFEIGPREALTGPIARGDVETVRAQIDAVRKDAPDVADAFVAMAKATAVFAGRTDELSEVVR